MSPKSQQPVDASGMEWFDFEPRLRGEHLRGKDVVVTIRAVMKEEVHPPGSPARIAPVMYFEKSNKGLVLTLTNQRTLIQMFGPPIANCIGKKVSLRAVPQVVAGRNTLPIHILTAKPGIQALSPAEKESDEVTAVAAEEAGHIS